MIFLPDVCYAPGNDPLNFGNIFLIKSGFPDYDLNHSRKFAVSV